MMKKLAVALHMTLDNYHRLDLALGVIKYAKEQPNWRVHGSFHTSKPVMNYQAWTGDGIISVCHYREQAEAILATGLPIVDMVEGFADARIVNVTPDNAEAGRLAAEHLLSVGFARFAFCHVAGTNWSYLRGRSFADAVGMPFTDMPVFARDIAWWQSTAMPKSLDRFLLSLPPRTAILAGDDNAGVKIAAACQRCGRSVPDDLAIMGIDGDTLQCELSYPSLSTIPLDGIRVGYEAARRLHELMLGQKRASCTPLRIPCKRAEVRASTETIVCADEAVRRALIYIRQNFASNLSVSDVARAAAVSRRTLEIRFRRHQGGTVLAEIHVHRLRHARYLLEDTELSVDSIYRRCGFMTHQLFYSMFKRRHGMTPQQYRKKHGAAKRGGEEEFS